MTNPDDQDAVLYAFAVEATHDRNTLERYLREYPELAEELIDLASELRLGGALGLSPAGLTADTGLEAAWQEFLACSPNVANPFARLKGEAFAKLATALNVPRSILTALRDGLVPAASIPQGFVRRFADATSSSVESIRNSFANPQPGLVSRAFKSEGKPSHQGQITFRELVLSTEMTDEQRQLLLQECDDDGLI